MRSVGVMPVPTALTVEPISGRALPMTDIYGENIGSLIDTLYNCFNGPPGLKRDWDMVQTLFIKGAHIMRTDMPEGGCTELVQMGVEEFIDSVEEFLHQKGFYGKEVNRRIETSGSLAKVLSDYEGRFDPDDPEPFRRGTNVISLYHDGFRWWIINMLLK
jgi:hypothetical protein